MIKKNPKYLQTNENIVKTPKLGNTKTSSCKQKKNIEEKKQQNRECFYFFHSCYPPALFRSWEIEKKSISPGYLPEKYFF